MSTAWGACISQLHCPLLPAVLLRATLSTAQLCPASTELPSEMRDSANGVLLMREWLGICYGFHNSQAMWPKDRHAWQQLLLHSLTKLGVHWVCVGFRTCNVQCTFRIHWIKCISLERQTSFGKKKFKNTNSNFSLRNLHILFLCWYKDFFAPYIFLFTL